jgi:hypothetical protein
MFISKHKKFFFFFIIYTLCLGIFFSYISIKVSESSQQYSFIKKITLILSEVPVSLKKIIETRSLNLSIPSSLSKHTGKPVLTQFKNNPRNALLILSRYDGDLNKSIIEIIDLNDFKIIHTYAHDVSEMNKLIDDDDNINVNHNEARFRYLHPFILNNGEVLSIGSKSFFKLDICSNLKFLNQNYFFHHSINIDNNKNFWVPARKKSLNDNKKNSNISISDDNIIGDGISKINQKGEIIFYKSMNEILVENNIVKPNHLLIKNDPIHINDIQPALKNSKYWKAGDLFISSRYLSSITHYRPSTNKVINYIQGPFTWQHDIDIISDSEISIFNNNLSVIPNKYSEVLIYSFKNNTFKKKFNNQLIENNFYTKAEGLSEIFSDGALYVEEQTHGRFIIFDKNGNKEIEYINKDNDGYVYILNWSRIIEDEKKISQIKENLQNKKC